MDECVVAIDDGSEGEFCLCKGCRFLVAPTLAQQLTCHTLVYTTVIIPINVA